MPRDEDTAKTEDEQPSGETADTETAADEFTEDDSGGDTSASDNSDDSEGEATPDEEPSIPKHRFDEVNTRMKGAEQRVEDLEQQIQYLTQFQQGQKKTETEEDVAAELKKQGYDQSQVDALVKLAKQYGGGEAAQKEVQALKQELAKEKDRSQREAAIAKYSKEGIDVSEQEVLDQMDKWYKAGDPKYQLSYEDIIFYMKKRDIAAKEVDASIKKKKTSADVKGAKTATEKKPEEKRFVYDPTRPGDSLQELENELIRQLEAEG